MPPQHRPTVSGLPLLTASTSPTLNLPPAAAGLLLSGAAVPAACFRLLCLTPRISPTKLSAAAGLLLLGAAVPAARPWPAAGRLGGCGGWADDGGHRGRSGAGDALRLQARTVWKLCDFVVCCGGQWMPLWACWERACSCGLGCTTRLPATLPAHQSTSPTLPVVRSRCRARPCKREQVETVGAEATEEEEVR